MCGGEELRLATADGETLVAWFFPAKSGLPLILYFHGNAARLSIEFRASHDYGEGLWSSRCFLSRLWRLRRFANATRLNAGR